MLRTDSEDNTGVARTVQTAIDWLERAAAESIRSCSGSTCSARTDRGTRPSPIATSTPPSSPTNSRPARKATWSRRADEDDEIDIEDVPVLIDVPAGAVGDVLDEAELFRLRRTYAGTRHAGRPLAGRAVRGAEAAGPDGRHAASSSRATRASRWASTAIVRRFRPWLYEELIHTPADHPAARRASSAAPGIRRSCRRSTCCPRSSRLWDSADPTATGPRP